MSLLLDALQRASKDKERAAAGGTASTPPLKIKDAAPGIAYPDLQESVAPTAVPDPAPPELSLETEETIPVPVPTLAVGHTAPTPPAAPAWEMTELTTQPEPVVPVQVAPARAATTVLETAKLSMAALDLTPAAAVVPPLAAGNAKALTQQTAVEQPKVANTSSNMGKRPTPAKVAQEIRRAYLPEGKSIHGKSAGNRRVMILGGLALVLALGFGSVLFGMWGDPMAWFGGGSSLASAPASAPVATTLPAAPVAAQPVAAASEVTVAAVAEPVATTPVQPNAVPGKANPTTKPVAAISHSVPTVAPKPARKPSGNEVAIGADASNSGFVAKTRGGNVLEAGYAALLEGKLDQASQAYTQALNENPEERDALLGLAYIAHKRGQREKAQDLYRRVLRQDPGNATAVAAVLALDNDDDNGTNVGRARELAQQQPDSPAAVAIAGSALAGAGQVAEALQYFARAQALEPNNAMHAYNHGVALDRLGQHAAARQQYERALTLADRGANRGTRTFSMDALRQRVEQLRQAVQPKTDSGK